MATSLKKPKSAARTAALKEREAARRVLEISPTNAQLIAIAKANPPKPEWFEDEEEKPF